MRIDRGLTHVALPVTDVEASLDFYRRFADMDVVHRRRDEQTGDEVVWVSDRTRPFVVVLIEQDRPGRRSQPGSRTSGWVARPARRWSGAASSPGARAAPCSGPHDSGPPVGYWAFITDPDGNNLELSHGQEVGLTVEQAPRA